MPPSKDYRLRVGDSIDGAAGVQKLSFEYTYIIYLYHKAQIVKLYQIYRLFIVIMLNKLY